MTSSTGILAFHNREAVKVKARVSAATLHRRSVLTPSDPSPEDSRKFFVDPQITTFEVLQNLLAKAFDIKSDFTIHYLAKDDEGKKTYLGLLSDWDLDAAFLSSSMPCLNLLIDLKPFEEEILVRQLLVSAQLRLKPGILHYDPLSQKNLSLEEWDVITPADLAKPPLVSHVRNNAQQTGNFFKKQMEKTLKTFSSFKFQRVLALAPDAVLTGVTERYKALKPPMSKKELQNFFDSEGRLLQPQELRRSVFHGGIEPSLRCIVWKYVLNVFPENYTKDQRVQYLKNKANEYFSLKAAWTDMQKLGLVTEEMQFIINMVKKDVLRTDRTHRFYAGSDDNKNVARLFYILTTFALNHPSVSYCQGMSDLASPMLVTMRDEAEAYICFVALMQRLKPNFNISGLAITEKFAHLSLLLQQYDSEFFDYLKSNGADDLLYCYRWLLLELKREFSFDDALFMLEVLWSSLPPSPPEKELPLYEIRFGKDSALPQSPRMDTCENPYTKVRRIRKQSSSSSLMCGTPKVLNGVIIDEAENNDASRCSSLNEVTDDDSQGYNPISDSIAKGLRMDLENLNKTVLGYSKEATPQHFTFDSNIEEANTLRENDSLWKLRKAAQGYCGTPDEQCELEFDSVEGEATNNQANRPNLSCQSSLDHRRSGSSTSASTSASSHSDLLQEKVDDSDYEDEHDAYRTKPPASHSEGYCSEATLSSKEVSCQEDARSMSDSGLLDFSRKSRSCLPPPEQLGGGNPFMMFLCLTLLLQHRDVIIRNHMDYNELAMHFDKMVRKHNVHRVLHETRIRFKEYLRIGWDASWEEHV